MSFGEDEEILQDFLVEAGEILEQLSEQLVDLERRPDDRALLNAIFRGFHTVKGGAGFLQLTALVELCHITENLFDMLRNGQRRVSAGLMDVVLQALDAVNEMFDEVKAGEQPSPAEPALLARLEALVRGEAAERGAETATAPVAAVEGAVAGDITDTEFEQFLDAIAPGRPEPAEAAAEEITEAEFEALLDQLHGGGTAAAAEGPVETAAAAAGAGAGGDEITEAEFEALLDQLHSGKAPGAAAAAPVAAAPAAAGGDDTIDDDEFEALLDQLHGKGRGPEAAAAAPKPAPASPAAAKIREAAEHDDGARQGPAKEAAETTVRVDTQRLDDIMNMVGELVLVRNRLVRLGARSGDEEIAKTVANLDVVTADLQTAVMKTRMQPIKKVFGRFPRVVRDLARSLNKEVTLELVGEETDLDKNLVEALADPLVHLVRNAVDHGVEMPDRREAAGKPRGGRIVLAAQQEGDHILLSITDDGAGMDADVLRRKVVEKGLMDADGAARLSESECYNLIFLPGFST
jgi:two-component system chemotaxis sensor kinase CheA